MKRDTVLSMLVFFMISMSGCWVDDSIPKQCFIRYELDGEPKEFYAGTGSRSGTALKYCFAWSNDNNDILFKIYIPIYSNPVVTYTSSDPVELKMEYDRYGDEGWSAGPDFTVTITRWKPGEYADNVRGTFSGTVTKEGVTKTVTNGTFEAWYYSSLVY